MSHDTPFAELTPEEREFLLRESREQAFKKGDFLFKSGEPVTGIFCIKSGVIRVTQSRGGNEVTLRLAAEGDWVGHRSIFTSETYRGSARAKESVRASFVPTDVLYRFFGSNRKFAHRLIRLIAQDLEATERLLLERARLNVPSRLISLFQNLDRQIGKPYAEGRVLATSLTKVEIAEMIGASQEVVSRQLSKWKRENLLREERKRFFLSRRLLDRIIQ